MRHPPASQRCRFGPDTTSAPWWSGVCFEHQQKHGKHKYRSQDTVYTRVVVVKSNLIVISVVVVVRLQFDDSPQDESLSR
jgi:hypothetical protein